MAVRGQPDKAMAIVSPSSSPFQASKLVFTKSPSISPMVSPRGPPSPNVPRAETPVPKQANNASKEMFKANLENALKLGKAPIKPSLLPAAENSPPTTAGVEVSSSPSNSGRNLYQATAIASLKRPNRPSSGPVPDSLVQAKKSSDPTRPKSTYTNGNIEEEDILDLTGPIGAPPSPHTSERTAPSHSPQPLSPFLSPVPSPVPSPRPPETAVSPRPEAAMSPANKTAEARRRVVIEIYDTEKTYLTGLDVIHDVFWKPLSAFQYLPPNDMAALFSNFKDIREVASRFMGDLEERKKQFGDEWAATMPLADLFDKHMESFKVYSQYLGNHPNAINTMESHLQSNQNFVQFIEGAMTTPRCNGKHLNSFLILPVQRIPRYKLLLNELLKHTPDGHPEHAAVLATSKRLDELCTFLNEKARTSATHYKMLELLDQVEGLNDGGSEFIRKSFNRVFVQEGLLHLDVTTGKKKLMKTMVFLFSDLLLYTFPRSGAVLTKSATIGNSLKNNATMAGAGASSSGVLYDFGALIHLNEHSRFVDVADTDERQHSFGLKYRDPKTQDTKQLFFVCADLVEKRSWSSALKKIINSQMKQKATLKTPLDINALKKENERLDQQQNGGGNSSANTTPVTSPHPKQPPSNERETPLISSSQHIQTQTPSPATSQKAVKSAADSIEKPPLPASPKAKRAEKTLSDSDPVQNTVNPLLHPFVAPHVVHNSDEELAPPVAAVAPPPGKENLSRSTPLLHQKVQHLAAGWGGDSAPMEMRRSHGVGAVDPPRKKMLEPQLPEPERSLSPAPPQIHQRTQSGRLIPASDDESFNSSPMDSPERAKLGTMERNMGTMERKQLSGLKIVPRQPAPARPAAAVPLCMDPIPPPGTALSPVPWSPPSTSPPRTLAIPIGTPQQQRQQQATGVGAPSTSPPKHLNLGLPPPPPSSSPPPAGLLSPRALGLPLPPPPPQLNDSPTGTKPALVPSPSKKALAKLGNLPPPIGPLPPLVSTPAPVSPPSGAAAPSSPRSPRGPLSPPHVKEPASSEPLVVATSPAAIAKPSPIVPPVIAVSKSGNIAPLTRPVAMLKTSGVLQRSASPAPGPMTRLAPAAVENRSTSAPRTGPGHQALAKLPPPPVLPSNSSANVAIVLPAPVAKPPTFKIVK